MNVEPVIKVLSKKRFVNLQNEKLLQVEIEKVLTEAGISFKREYHADANNIFDFLLDDGVVLEVKIKGRKREIYRQITRYAELEVAKAFILLSNVPIGFPNLINNKPCTLLQLSNSWL